MGGRRGRQGEFDDFSPRDRSGRHRPAIFAGRGHGPRTGSAGAASGAVCFCDGQLLVRAGTLEPAGEEAGGGREVLDGALPNEREALLAQARKMP